MNIIDRIKSRWFWFRHGIIVNLMIKTEYEKRSRAAYKGHETRKRRDQMGIIIQRTNCDH